MAVNQNVLDDIMATQPDEERLGALVNIDNKRPRLELDPVMSMVNEVIDAMWEKGQLDQESKKKLQGISTKFMKLVEKRVSLMKRKDTFSQ